MLASQKHRLATRGQLLREQLNPCTIQIGGAINPEEAGVAASTIGLQAGDSLMLGGQLPDEKIAFRVRLSLLTARPKSGERIRWVERSLTFRIQTVGDLPGSDPAVRLDCQSIAK